MSSNAYSAELRPEPCLRLVVLVAGIVLFLAGSLLVLLLPITFGFKVTLAFIWLIICGYEWSSNRLAYSRGGSLRVDSGGGIERKCRDGCWRPAKLAAGSVVTPRLAWLRISVGRGQRYGELFRGDARENVDWRRFQVIWRHIGANL